MVRVRYGGWVGGFGWFFGQTTLIEIMRHVSAAIARLGARVLPGER